MHSGLHFDYTAVGHVTVDVLADGSRRPGGSAFYSALQAARLGCRALILTQGVVGEIEEMLAPFSHEIELRIAPATETTTLFTRYCGARRRQRMLAWAGPMAEEVAVDSAVLHLAPIAREYPRRWRGPHDFVALTPQGLVREWADPGREVRMSARADPEAVPVAARCNAVVVSEHERVSCRVLLASARQAGAVIAVTAGAAPATLELPDGRTLTLQVPTLERVSDDLGAGDVFAAAFFTLLAEGASPASAAQFANAAAAVRVQGSGADAVGDRKAIRDRLDAVGCPP